MEQATKQPYSSHYLHMYLRIYLHINFTSPLFTTGRSFSTICYLTLVQPQRKFCRMSATVVLRVQSGLVLVGGDQKTMKNVRTSLGVSALILGVVFLPCWPPR